MRATTVMLAALGLAVVGRWAHNAKITGGSVAKAAFAFGVIALLDNPATAPVAQGFAWLFFVAVALGNNSPITGVSRAVAGK